MKVLFVCRGNIGRSQMAAEFYNARGVGAAQSAGTAVDPPDQRIGDRPGAANAIAVMKECGLDISNNRSHQLHQTDIGRFDKVIVMSETEHTPPWLTDSPLAEVWRVKDPKGQDIRTTRKIRDQIKNLVDKL